MNSLMIAVSMGLQYGVPPEVGYPHLRADGVDDLLTAANAGIPAWRHAGPDGRAVLVTVEDEGPGIPEDKLTAIFDRFYSERPAGEKFGTHSGLGLSISKQIVEAHRGRIWAESEPGSGSTFIFEIPLRAEEANEA